MSDKLDLVSLKIRWLSSTAQMPTMDRDEVVAYLLELSAVAPPKFVRIVDE